MGWKMLTFQHLFQFQELSEVWCCQIKAVCSGCNNCELQASHHMNHLLTAIQPHIVMIQKLFSFRPYPADVYKISEYFNKLSFLLAEILYKCTPDYCFIHNLDIILMINKNYYYSISSHSKQTFQAEKHIFILFTIKYMFRHISISTFSNTMR